MHSSASTIAKSLFLAMAITATAASAAEGFVCTEEKATGFQKIAGEWQIRIFPTDDRYLLTPLDGDDTHEWIVIQIDAGLPVARCHDSPRDAEYLDCHGIQTLWFARESGRFITSFLHGFTDDDSLEGPYTPYIAIGSCVPLEPPPAR
jgi:hypothetical protein